MTNDKGQMTNDKGQMTKQGMVEKSIIKSDPKPN